MTSEPYLLCKVCVHWLANINRYLLLPSLFPPSPPIPHPTSPPSPPIPHPTSPPSPPSLIPPPFPPLHPSSHLPSLSSHPSSYLPSLPSIPHPTSPPSPPPPPPPHAPVLPPPPSPFPPSFSTISFPLAVGQGMLPQLVHLGVGETGHLECPPHTEEPEKWCFVNNHTLSIAPCHVNNKTRITVNGSLECPEPSFLGCRNGMNSDPILPACDNMLLYCLYDEPACSSNTIPPNPYIIVITVPQCHNASLCPKDSGTTLPPGDISPHPTLCPKDSGTTLPPGDISPHPTLCTKDSGTTLPPGDISPHPTLCTKDSGTTLPPGDISPHPTLCTKDSGTTLPPGDISPHPTLCPKASGTTSKDFCQNTDSYVEVCCDTAAFRPVAMVTVFMGALATGVIASPIYVRWH